MTIEKYDPIDKFECIRVFQSNMPKFLIEQELIDFQNWIGENDCPNFYVLRKSDSIVGFIGFYLERKQARLVYLTIDIKHQNKGHGRALLDHAIQEIKKKDKDLTICLDAKTSNYTYFEKLGFRIVEIIPKYYYSNLDKYEMVLHTYPFKKKTSKKKTKSK